MRNKLNLIVAGAVAAIATAGATTPGLAQEFKARTLTIVVGYPPAGGYDTNARFLARHFGKHLPGNPNIVVQNQPGAGSLNAANLVYNTGPKDGSQLVMFASSAAVEPLLKNPKAKFDIAKFKWIGNIHRDTASCAAWKTTGIKTWADIAKRPTSSVHPGRRQ